MPMSLYDMYESMDQLCSRLPWCIGLSAGHGQSLFACHRPLWVLPAFAARGCLRQAHPDAAYLDLEDQTATPGTTPGSQQRNQICLPISGTASIGSLPLGFSEGPASPARLQYINPVAKRSRRGLGPRCPLPPLLVHLVTGYASTKTLPQDSVGVRRLAQTQNG